MKSQNNRECKNCSKVCSKYVMFNWDKFLLCKQCTMDFLRGKYDEE